MFNKVRQRRGKRFFKLSGLLLLIAASAFLYNIHLARSQCKGLQPCNNLDELLYQFYINLDSDCLFNMPVEELEKIWGIEIASGGIGMGVRKDSDSSNKAYKSDEYGFRVKKGRLDILNPNKDEFWIRGTQSYQEKYRTLFPDGKFPKLLPIPLKKDKTRIGARCYTGVTFSYVTPAPDNPGVYSDNGSYTYYWLSSDQKRMITLSGEAGAVTGIWVTSFVPSDFKTAN